MDFWRWYLSLLRSIFSPWQWVKSALLEYGVGVLILAGLSVGFGVQNPLSLLATIPVGFTVAAHGWWRWNHLSEK